MEALRGQRLALVPTARFSTPNGITEGLHSKMEMMVEMMSRRAYGFRNFEHHRLRVLAHCGWNGTIGRA
jgi:transposase